MRDPGRMKPTLRQLRRVWKQHPDLRLGQLIVNLSRDLDPFYIEDDDLVARARSVERDGFPSATTFPNTATTATSVNMNWGKES